MRFSKLYAPHLIEHHDPKNLETHEIIEKAGLIDYTRSGFYTILPLATMVMNKLKNKIRDLALREDFQEIELPKIQPTKFLKSSGRFCSFQKEIYRLSEEFGDLCLCPTNEEAINYLIRDKLFNRQLPLAFFQFSEVFKNNTPARGLISSSEFHVFESYSFHHNAEKVNEKVSSFEKIVEELADFANLELHYVQTENKDYGNYLEKVSTGQHKFLLCQRGHASLYESGERCGKCGERNLKERGLGIAMYKIFDDSFARNAKASFVDSRGETKFPYLATYGIGLSRLIYSIVDSNRDDEGIVWPATLVPFEYFLSPQFGRDLEQSSKTTQIYTFLKSHGKNVLFDDRINERIGSKIKTSRFLGIPKTIVVTKTKIMLQKRNEKTQSEINLESILK